MHVELCLNLNMRLAQRVVPSVTEFLQCLWLMRDDVDLGVTVVDSDGENTLKARKLNPLTFPKAIESLYRRENAAEIINKDLEPGDMEEVVKNIQSSDLFLVLTRAPHFTTDLQAVADAAEKRGHRSIYICILREDDDTTPSTYDLSPSSLVSLTYVAVSDDLELFKMRKKWLRDLAPVVSIGLRLSSRSGVFVDLSPSLVSVSSKVFEQTLFQECCPRTKNGIVRMKSIQFVELKHFDFSLLCVFFFGAIHRMFLFLVVLQSKRKKEALLTRIKHARTQVWSPNSSSMYTKKFSGLSRVQTECDYVSCSVYETSSR